MTATRRLAAILAADVAGYSRLIERDEAGTLAALRKRRKGILDPMVARHHGRVVKLMGDGVLVEFGSAVNAVACSADLQKQFAAANEGLAEDRRIVLRVGVNLGDVVVEGGDLYGDGVIIADRLQAMAEPGGICISGSVHEQVAGKLDAAFDDLGPCKVKNSLKPVHVFRVKIDGAEPAQAAAKLQSKPSIAVLPFANLSGDAEQQYFSDGITEDIITELSRFRQMHVLARNSSFRYRGNDLDMVRVGRELGVHYLVEGSVRRMGARIRIAAQLIDARSGHHLWAERFDRDKGEIFAVEDEVVQTVVGTVVGRVQAVRTEIAKRRPPRSLAAYDLVLRGKALCVGDPQADAEARLMFERAIEIDPHYGLAHAMLALMFYHEWSDTSADAVYDRAFEHARKSVELDDNESYCHLVLGHLHLFRRTFDLAEQFYRRAVEINPNNPEHLTDMGVLVKYLGRPDEAWDWLRRAKRVDPYFDPPWYWHELGLIHYTARRYDEAITAYERSPTRPPWVWAFMAACYAQAGQIDKATHAAAETMAREPSFTIGDCKLKEPFKNPADLDHLLDGLRKAGLPE